MKTLICTFLYIVSFIAFLLIIALIIAMIITLIGGGVGYVGFVCGDYPISLAQVARHNLNDIQFVTDLNLGGTHRFAGGCDTDYGCHFRLIPSPQP